MYIVLEGVVGTGKSTQSKKLTDALRALHPDRRIERVREPGSTPIAETIRNVVQGTRHNEDMHPLTDAYLYASARAQLLHGYIQPILQEGGIVIADRSVASSLAYQGHAQGLGLEKVWEINRHAVGDMLPDLILSMDMDVRTGYERTFDPEGDKRERMDLEFFLSVAAGYQRVSQMDVFADRWVSIDASGTIDDVHTQIMQVVDEHFSD